MDQLCMIIKMILGPTAQAKNVDLVQLCVLIIQYWVNACALIIQNLTQPHKAKIQYLDQLRKLKMQIWFNCACS